MAPNKAKTPGVKTKYILNGNDHTKAINNNEGLKVKEENIAKQAGSNSIINVVSTGSASFGFE